MILYLFVVALKNELNRKKTVVLETKRKQNNNSKNLFTEISTHIIFEIVI